MKEGWVRDTPPQPRSGSGYGYKRQGRGDLNRSGTSKQERDEIWSPPPRHRRGGGREKRDHGEGEKKKRETAQEGERLTARVFGLREFSAGLRFRFVMRQKKGAAALFIGRKEGTLGFCQTGCREAHSFMKLFGPGTGPVQWPHQKFQRRNCSWRITTATFWIP